MRNDILAQVKWQCSFRFAISRTISDELDSRFSVVHISSQEVADQLAGQGAEDTLMNGSKRSVIRSCERIRVSRAQHMVEIHRNRLQKGRKKSMYRTSQSTANPIQQQGRIQLSHRRRGRFLTCSNCWQNLHGMSHLLFCFA